MSVTIANRKDATEIIDNAENSASQARKNFFDVFGTTGCLLNCRDADAVKQNFGATKGYSRAVKREMRASRLEKSNQKWFVASDISTSATQGCGSCKVLSQILAMVFDGTEQSLSEEYEYSVSHDFELKRRPLGEEKYIEMTQLFQPPGMLNSLPR